MCISNTPEDKRTGIGYWLLPGLAHGNVTPQVVDTQIWNNWVGHEWLDPIRIAITRPARPGSENRGFRTTRTALRVHGLEAIFRRMTRLCVSLSQDRLTVDEWYTGTGRSTAQSTPTAGCICHVWAMCSVGGAMGHPYLVGNCCSRAVKHALLGIVMLWCCCVLQCRRRHSTSHNIVTMMKLSSLATSRWAVYERTNPLQCFIEDGRPRRRRSSWPGTGLRAGVELRLQWRPPTKPRR